MGAFFLQKELDLCNRLVLLRLGVVVLFSSDLRSGTL